MILFRDPERALRAFVAPSRGPGTTLPIVVLAVTVSAIAMHVDNVQRYSSETYFIGIGLSAVLAAVVARGVARIRNPNRRGIGAFLMSTVAGALIGVIVQALIYGATWGWAPLRDLGGAIDTMHPTGWVLGGIILGGVPALAVSLFVALAARAAKSVRALDASESFTVAYAGIAGIAATIGCIFLDRNEVLPVVAAAVLAFGSVAVAMLVDGQRLRAVRHAFSGKGDYEVVPRERFQSNDLAAMVDVGVGRVLVRVDPRPDYRSAAAEPIALVGYDEKTTCQPIARRRFGAAAMMLAMAMFGTMAAAMHGLFG